jgi:hypothetical protein
MPVCRQVERTEPMLPLDPGDFQTWSVAWTSPDGRLAWLQARGAWCRSQWVPCRSETPLEPGMAVLGRILPDGRLCPSRYGPEPYARKSYIPISA